MINKLKKYLTSSSHRKLLVEKNKEASFKLMLDDMEVGRLSYKEPHWMFVYTEEFKENHGIKPLATFPDINKKYKSEELWPFFSSRIPSLARTKVKNAILEEGIKENDLLALLNRFGKRTITNPFELLSTD
ncbi:MAG TPA: HipA N-terminal domain-containing protein [Fulvivirga sp.]|nr:HipA N-terminal domain-containing protein [Fulvivirga sp.]